MDAQSSMMARERQEGEKKCVFTRNDSITQILLCVAQLGNRCTHRHFSPFPVGNLIYSFVFFFFFFLQVHQLRRSLSFARSLTSWRFPSLNSEPMSIRRLSQRRIIFHLRSMKCAIGWTPCFDWFLFFSLSLSSRLRFCNGQKRSAIDRAPFSWLFFYFLFFFLIGI